MLDLISNSLFIAKEFVISSCNSICRNPHKVEKLNSKENQIPSAIEAIENTDNVKEPSQQFDSKKMTACAGIVGGLIGLFGTIFSIFYFTHARNPEPIEKKQEDGKDEPRDTLPIIATKENIAQPDPVEEHPSQKNVEPSIAEVVPAPKEKIESVLSEPKPTPKLMPKPMPAMQAQPNRQPLPSRTSVAGLKGKLNFNPAMFNQAKCADHLKAKKESEKPVLPQQLDLPKVEQQSIEPTPTVENNNPPKLKHPTKSRPPRQKKYPSTYVVPRRPAITPETFEQPKETEAEAQNPSIQQ